MFPRKATREVYDFEVIRLVEVVHIPAEGDLEGPVKFIERDKSWNGKNAIDDGVRDVENLDMKNHVGGES